jgi:hypothetical protein
MRTHTKLFIIVACYLLCQSANADPSRLMNDAISLNANVEGMSQKTRLGIYEKISDKLNNIILEYPGSDEARVILSGASIGTFSPADIQQKFINELTDYHRSTCKVSPSYTCLGYVSLNQASQLCKSASTFRELDEAYSQFNNSLKVFSSQNADNRMTKLVLTTAKRCTSGINLSEWEKGYYSSLNAQMLIDAGLVDQAKAIIQDTNTPYFKFMGVIGLREASPENVDKDYLSRLEVFIDDKIARKDDFGRPVDHNAFLAHLRLTKLALDRSDLGITSNRRSFVDGSIDPDKAFDSYNKYGPYPCNVNYVNFMVSQIMDYQTSLAKRLLASYGSSIPPRALDYIAGELSPGKRIQQFYFRNCGEGYQDYSLMIDIFGQLLARAGVDKGMVFREEISRGSFSRQELYSALYNKYLFSNDELISKFINSKGKYTGPKEAAFPIFKNLVDGGKVCESSSILFQTLADTQDFDKAVGYILSSKNVDSSEKYSCGDEDLELLLN